MEKTIRLFKCVWEILPIQPTIYNPGRALHTRCGQQYVSKYLRNTKKLDVSRQGVLNCIDLHRKNQTWKFPFSAVLITMGHPKRPLTYKQTDSKNTKFSSLDSYGCYKLKRRSMALE